jgi:asparagine synthase (glutamine-hydrolysing)
MCGITGFIDFTKQSSLETLVAMRETLVHRGPDDKGEELIHAPEALVGLGFRRLSIIDLTPAGHQPMHNPEDGNCIVFNGEIYNYREIKQELTSLGHTFISQSDTEVILKSYQQWGKSCVTRFTGMFAIALFDKKNNKLILIRDRAGVKPLYYYRAGKHLLFGSELKSFHPYPAFEKSIDTNALSLYFQFGYIPAPYSIFRDTCKLSPGHLLELDLATGAHSIEKYWDATDCYNQERLQLSFEEAMDETERLMSSAFQYRMVADVPVGVFLSGGYDSTAVAALLQKNATQKIKTFTIGFREEKYDEAPHARAVANHLGTDHHELYCTIRDAIDIIPQLPSIYDEPFGDSSAVPTTLVSRLARKQVTVALSADGGDELFAGYPRHKKVAGYLETLSKVPDMFLPASKALLGPFRVSNDLSRTNRIEKLYQVFARPDDISRFKTINQTFTSREARSLFAVPTEELPTAFDQDGLYNSHNDALSKVLATEYKTYLVDDILQKVDRATMSASLEGRDPFLDHRLLEFVARLPGSFKLHNGSGKYILKQIVHRHVPETLMNRPKMGFGIPVEQWCKNELKEFVLDFLSDDSLQRVRVLNKQQAINIRDAYFAGKLENFERFWFLLVFVMWHRKWME